MNDKQMIIAIKVRVSKRPGNFFLFDILDELIIQSRSRRLERDIMNRFTQLCKIYNIKLDKFDMECIGQQRTKCLEDKERRSRLREAGLGI